MRFCASVDKTRISRTYVAPSEASVSKAAELDPLRIDSITEVFLTLSQKKGRRRVRGASAAPPRAAEPAIRPAAWRSRWPRRE